MKLGRKLLGCGAICALGFFSSTANPSAITPDLTTLAGRGVNRTATVLVENGRQWLRVDEAPGTGLVWVPEVKFSTGTINVDIRGKDIFQRSFVGIAFHGGDGRHEVVYLRPFNFRAQDPVRRSHAIQYSVHPDFPWDKLRSEVPGEFESGIDGALDPDGWVHLRLEVTPGRVRAFVGGVNKPALDVKCLCGLREGLVGLWVGEGSGGDFANLQIEPLPARSTRGFPVVPEVFIDRFRAAEEITFNGEGHLFIGADQAIWVAEPDGNVRKIAEVHTHLGQAGIGPQDILAADFGPTNVFQHGPNDDGIVWRITPDGQETVVATGIADPNAILVLPDGTFLVSDDGTDKIYRVQDNKVSVWSTGVPYPNGMALSPDAGTLYVAQIFKSLQPIVADDRIWAFKLSADFSAAGPPNVAGRTGEGGVDGLVADEFGRIYIADNGAGKIWRLDPKSGVVILIAEGMPGVASLVFGEGKFDHEAIYATSTRRGCGKIWKVRVGAKGARQHR